MIILHYYDIMGGVRLFSMHRNTIIYHNIKTGTESKVQVLFIFSSDDLRLKKGRRREQQCSFIKKVTK
jgi:hypothetical protein